MKNILVTGGAGFIGSHVVDTLINLHYKVKVLDNLSFGTLNNLESNLSNIEFIKGDIRSKETCYIATKNIDCILHFAALKSVPKSLLNPSEFNEVNIQGILNLLESCIKNKVKKFVFSSSSSVYGDVSIFPQKEENISYPISPYGLTKLTGEYYCKIFSKWYNLDTISLRYFNVFGERQTANDDYAGVIPKFINAMLNNKNPTIFGDGIQSRDFTYVQNIVNANILSIKSRNIFKGQSFNIAGGQSISILDLVNTINNLLKTNIAPKFLPKRTGDILKSQADISNTINKLGFFYQTSFIKGLEKTINYWKNEI